MTRPGVGPNPTPLILTRGWPWTFWHWSKVIDLLADPRAHGGDPADAFEVIVPSVPGFGFSTPLPNNPDMNFWKVADLWHALMTRTLGYERYGAAGCDVGALVCGQLGHKYTEELYAIHIGSGQKFTLRQQQSLPVDPVPRPAASHRGAHRHHLGRLPKPTRRQHRPARAALPRK